MPGTIDAVFFDLDGTLLDTLDDLAHTANTALLRCGHPGHPTEAYRYFVGNGMETLIRRAAPQGLGEEEMARLIEAMREEYGKHWARETRPYPGIAAMLERLVRQGMPFGVLSNKPDEFTQMTVRHFFPGTPFFKVQGSPRGGRAKPDPTLALAMAEEGGFAPGRVLFMGDSSVDMDTATAAGMIPAGVLWGFRPESELREHGAKYLLKTPEDLFEIL